MLTVEQKINMLILAGYEPCVLVIEREHVGEVILPRVIGHGNCLGIGIEHADEWVRWDFSIADFDTSEYTRSVWGGTQLELCPDELIYQALEAAK
jgi:hypothetical protein